MINKHNILKNNIRPLKELSKDTASNEFMCEFEIEAIDFDAVKKTYTNELCLSEECSTSVDALLPSDGKIIFIEFKNGNMSNEKRSVKDKMRDSLLIFCDITVQTISNTRENSDFILVYNSEKNPTSRNREYIEDRVSTLGNQEMIRFGLDKYKILYFNNVHTYNKAEFENYINKNILHI